MSLARRHELLEWARRSHAWIVEDDYDCDTRYQSQPLPCLHALDPDGRVIYVGTFSKTLFPALRLGFLIVPRDLQAGFITARLATDLHPPVLEQLVLARSSAVVTTRATCAACKRHTRNVSMRCDAPSTVRVRRCECGRCMPACMRSLTWKALAPSGCTRKPRAQGIETMPLSAYYFGAGKRANALLLGFGSVSPAAIRAGVTKLARVIEAVRTEA